jgi:hypothetical protein
MTVSTGTKLGPYEIVAPLGAGGPPSLVSSHGETVRLP